MPRWKKKVNIIKYFIEHGADINKKKKKKKKEIWGYTIRLFNVEKEMKKVVKCLIEHGAGVNKANDSNETALYCACEKGNKNRVKYI